MTIRCAIYTRKSSEEGLEQEFNSLHAQREACEAFIKSQKHEGWQLIKTAYDDGGISGGTMQRAGLQALLSDIALGKIDVVVVYKVDRLTRSLADFAKMVELFDKQQVSFVSVTQQFNTTSSMGRLTLNVLLSFAQFEREVTGERIRDKVAASRKKGMWMGGGVALGYHVQDKKLVIAPDEAKTVRYVFTSYLALRCVRLLQQKLQQENIRSRSGCIMTRGMLYHMLSNPLYIGKARHKNAIYDGMHEAIIDNALWQQVQDTLTQNRCGKKGRTIQTDVSFLSDKLFDVSGEKLLVVHANKKGRRYRYYTSQSLTGKSTKATSISTWRLPAPEIERIVREAALPMLQDASSIISALQQAQVPADAWQSIRSKAQDATDLTPYLHRIILSGTEITISLSLNHLLPGHNEPVLLTHTLPLQIRRKGVEMRMIIPSTTTPARVDQNLIRILAKAHHWWNQLVTGQARTLTDIAAAENTHSSYIGDVVKLAFLSPAITESILSGKQPAHLNSMTLMRRTKLDFCWQEQKAALGC